MGRPLKKKPSDYPTMAFRVSEEEKQLISELMDEVHRLANRKISPDEKRIKKNELFVDAIKRGLRAIQKSYR